jgi:hypothetical protein
MAACAGNVNKLIIDKIVKNETIDPKRLKILIKSP